MSEVSAAIRRLNSTTDNRRLAAGFIGFCRAIATARGDVLQAEQIAATHYAEYGDIERVLRAAVPAGSTTSDPALVQLQPMAAGFLASNQWPAAFDRIAPFAMTAPLQHSVISVSAIATGSIVAEGNPGPLTQLGFSNASLLPKTAIAIVAFSDLIRRFELAGSDELIRGELGKAASAAIDAQFLSSLYAQTTPSGSAGADLTGIRTDLQTMLSGISLGEQSMLFVIASPANVLALALAVTSTGDRAFPGVGISGGILMPGVTLIPSSNLPTGAVLAIDAGGMVMNPGTLRVDSSGNADLQMSTAPDSPPTANTTWVSLFQQNLFALRLVRLFGFSVGRSGSLASLSGVAWGS